MSDSAHLPRELKIGDTLPDEVVRLRFNHQISEEMAAFMAKSNLEEKDMAAAKGEQTPPDIFDFEMTGTVVNRRVEVLQRVKTPAGEFECWRIGYDMVGPKDRVVGFGDAAFKIDGPSIYWDDDSEAPAPLTTRCFDYISPEVGLVKREKMSNNGK